MTAPHVIDPAGLLGQALSQASPDLMLPCSSTSFTRCYQRRLTRCARPSGANKTRSVTPGAMCIATGPWTPGSAPLTWRSPSCAQEPTSRQWLLQRRKRCESALITVVAHCYLAGVSTRRMDKRKAVTRNGSGADS